MYSTQDVKNEFFRLFTVFNVVFCSCFVFNFKGSFCMYNKYVYMNEYSWMKFEHFIVYLSIPDNIRVFFSHPSFFFSNLNNFCIHYKLVYIMNEIWTHPCVPLNSSFCPADRALNTSIYIKLSVDLSKNHERNSIIHLVSGWNL